MKVQVISDLHLEFLSPTRVQSIISKIFPLGDVLVLAGDIGCMDENHFTFLRAMSQKFPKVFVITGNHEYYRGEISTRDQELATFCSSLDNVSLLCSSSEDYGGFRWVGTTLWSRVSENGCFINDIRYIKDMTISKYNQLHQEAVDFLTQTLSTSIPTIVITHHLPSMEVVSEKYKNDVYNQWFASSSLEHVLETATNHVPLWIYGHTHQFSDRMIHNTRMVCNPYGYENENTNPNLNHVIAITDNVNHPSQ